MNRPLRVLVLEDSALDAEMVIRELRRAGFDPEWQRVETKADFQAALESSPDLILSDYSLPHFDGLRAAGLLRERGLDIPFILVSGTVGEDAAVEAMRNGATDYLLKDRIMRLGPAVERALEGKRLRDEHRRMDSQLHESEERLRLALHAAHLGTFDWDVPHNRIIWSRWHEELWAFQPGEFPGTYEAFASRVHPDDLPGINDEVARCIASRESFVREFRIVWPDGSVHWIMSRGEFTFDGSGQPLRMRGVVMDVTDRKLAEAALRESEERFRELAETIQEVFWITDPSRHQMLYVSPAYETIWGRSRQSLYDQPHTWFEAIHAEDRERVRHAATTCQAGGAYDEEFRIVRADGEVRWIRDWAFPVRNAAGQVERIVGVARDITDRKHAQEELQHKEERFRLLIENASDLISVVNRDGLIRFQSPSVLHLLGYQPDELVGRSAFEFIHPEDVTAATALLHRAQSNPADRVSAEHRFRHRDGQWRLLQTIGRSIPDQAVDGYIVLNSRDITASRQVEEQFRQAQKLEAIGQLAGGIAHDFNNILTGMMMQTELTLMTENLTEAAQEGLREIRVAAEKASRLTRQLLLYSRRQVMQPSELDLNEAVASLVRMLQRIIGEDVYLQLHLHPSPLMTRADAGMLDQVLMNLAVNARDAMPEGGRLTIETGEQTVDEDFARLQIDAAPGRYVWLSVSDTGGGIPPEILPRIFDPFFTTKEPGKGTGLGLATVFGIVKQHRGWINVLSEPGQGARFQIFLPAGVATHESRAGAALKPRPRGGTETILLTEDEPYVRALTRALLERRGYRVLEAANGVEALQVWQEHRASVALLLTDLVMPEGMTGQQLARRLQADNPNLRIVITSGYSAEIAGREFEARSGEAFVQKPCSPNQLLETVRRCLDDRPPAP